ncbi:MAG: T9SS type A sorting domain-containing protein [Paludibacter sp.]|nr:T9SS type A sorting domain-containing protein [Paludibacter sp.]
MNKQLILGIFCFAAAGMLTAQVQMGQWQSYLAYNNAVMIEQTPERVFAVAKEELFNCSNQSRSKYYTLFSIGIEDHDIQTYSKATGLNGANIAQIKYDEATKQLIIIYADGNIDLMSNNGIVNIPDLYLKLMSADKTVNHIKCYNSNAYLSTPFGIVVINLKKAEISDTYYIGGNSSDVKVLATDIFNGKLYACSSDSIYFADLNSNLVNFQSWNTLSNLPGSGAIQSLAAFAGNLFVLRNGTLYVTSDFVTWNIYLYNRTKIKVANNRLYVLWDDGAGYYDETMLGFNTVILQNYDLISDYLYIGGNNWFAANKNGIAIQPNGEQTASFFTPNSPAYNSIWNLSFYGQKLYVLHGGRDNVQFCLPAYISIFENNSWKIITPEEVQTVTQTSTLDYVQIAFDPTIAGHYYVTSFGTGLYEFQDDKFVQRYIGANTGGILEVHPSVSSSPNFYTRLYGLTFDKQGNLMIDNCSVGATIKMRKKDGTWTQMNYPKTQSTNWSGQIGTNALNPNQKWVISTDQLPSILVIDDDGTPGNQSDDRSKFFRSFNYIKNGAEDVATPSKCYCFAQDKSGTIWIGTHQGPLIFNNTNNIFDANYLASKVLIPRNDTTGLGDFLLEGIAVTAIAVDGANRKWIGTATSGAYLVSDNGVKTIKHFTTENSPLPNNSIQAIAINPVTGEVFFGTPSGLVSYQGDAAESETQNFTNVTAYPNPVKPNFQGVVTITGLIDNSLVRITDAAGNAVYQTNSNGSIATWNLLDNFGRRVDSGVYVVMVVSEDGSKHIATKIMVFK